MTGEGSWWEVLRADPLPWLFDGAPQNVLWRVLVELFERPEESIAVQRARSGANIHEPIASLLAPLMPDGSWGLGEEESSALTPGDRIVLAVQAGADPGDPRLHRAADRLLEEPYQTAGVCTIARQVQALMALGWEHDLRLEERVAWLGEEAAVAPDGGWSCEDSAHAGPAGSCTVSAVAVLGASAERSEPHWVKLRDRAVESLVPLLGRDEPAAPEGWTRAGHPNLYRTDMTETLWALARAGVPYDVRMQPALIRLQAGQDDGGRWELGVGAPAGCDAAGEETGAPSRWITLHALVALKAYASPHLIPVPDE